MWLLAKNTSNGNNGKNERESLNIEDIYPSGRSISRPDDFMH
jgi:hypothetical protein